jgi:hypothetical protein
MKEKLEKAKILREKVEMKYIISGLVSFLLFLVLLSAAPSPWWFDKQERSNTTLEMTTWEFMTYATTFGDTGVNTSTCAYIDDNCYITENLQPAKASSLHPIYSAVAAFNIMAIVLTFALGVASNAFAFFSRKLPENVILIINIVNAVLALVLCFFIIITWVLLISRHKYMIQDSLNTNNDAAMCDLYQKIDINLGGTECSFAARVLDSSGNLARSWGPQAGWILSVCAFWIALLVYLPLTLLWIMITSANVNICPTKDGGGKGARSGKDKKTIELDSYGGSDSKDDQRRTTTSDAEEDESSEGEVHEKHANGHAHEESSDSESESEEDKSQKKKKENKKSEDEKEKESESESESESEDESSKDEKKKKKDENDKAKESNAHSDDSDSDSD